MIYITLKSAYTESERDGGGGALGGAIGYDRLTGSSVSLDDV